MDVRCNRVETAPNAKSGNASNAPQLAELMHQVARVELQRGTHERWT